MKIPQTSGKLARKRAILEAVVSEIDADFSRFHRILGTNKTNVVEAVERLRSASTTTVERFSVPCRRKRKGGLSDDVKSAVTIWWTAETRVSPNRKDIRRKRLGRNLYDTHPAHLLMETQVSLPQRVLQFQYTPSSTVIQYIFFFLGLWIVLRKT